MEQNKALICGAMLAHSNMGFGLPPAIKVRSEIHPRTLRIGRSFPPTVSRLVENFFQERIETDEHMTIMSEETESWVTKFELDSYTDEQFEKDFPHAAKLYALASLRDDQIIERFERLYNSIQTVDLFHTPESKEAMTAWLETQATEMPTGIAVMVGFNYGMNQARMLIEGTHSSTQTPG